MASETIPFDLLLRPLSDESPTGFALRDERSGFMRDFYEIRDAANQARTAERKLANYIPPPPGEEDPYKPDPPNWDCVLSQAIDILSHKSKDLWVAAWMIEALCRVHGFAGLRDGFKLTRELCDRYWEALHPRGSEGDVEELVAVLAGLNGVEGEGTLIDPIKDVPLISGGGGGPYSYTDYLTAVRLEREQDANRREQRIADGETSMPQFEASMAQSSPEYFADLLLTIDEAIAEFDQLNQVLDLRCRAEDTGRSWAPPSSNISNVLAEVRRHVALWAGHDEAGAAQSAGHDVDASGEALSGSQSFGVSGGPVASREDAFRAISKIADYFEKTEPHSPVSYGLRQVVRWGRLSLPELLAQLIDNQDTRNQLFRQIGIQTADAADD